MFTFDNCDLCRFFAFTLHIDTQFSQGCFQQEYAEFLKHVYCDHFPASRIATDRDGYFDFYTHLCETENSTA